MINERTIAILGPGLLGGSLALAIRERNPGCQIRLWARREEAVADLKKRHLADLASTSLDEVVQGASLVILATPITVMEALAKAMLPSLASDAVVTDVGSVKRSVVEPLEPIFSSAQRLFVGSHPMAGSERAGIEAARADLFTGAACIVTPTPQSDPAAAQRVQDFWTALGCRVLSMSPGEHDRKIARISHLPHAVAAALTLAALEADPQAAECAGNGLRDSTRIAGGDPDLWTGILTENRTEVIAALEDAAIRTKELLDIIRSGDNEKLRRFLAEAQQLRSRVPPPQRIMASIKVRRHKQIPAEITVPGDKSISHRAAMFAGLADGRTMIEGFLPSEDCICTVHAMEALGAEVEWLEETPGVGFTKLAITGHGMKLQAPTRSIDCGNSGTTTRLLAGILAGQPFTTHLTGDASLSKRPMKRVADPLALMGAKVEGQGEKICAPLSITGGHLKAIQYTLPMASAQVKSAVLLAGMFAPGKTSVVEPVPTRNHTERLMSHFGIKWLRDGDTVSVYGGQAPRPTDIIVPGDISSAAFWMVAVSSIPGAQITLKNVGLNPTRTGVIDVLLAMGAQVTSSESQSDGEPRGNVVVKGAELNATTIGGAKIPNVIDELPILAVAAALARGTTVIRDAAELRVKETDRIAAVADNLRRMGVTVTERDDGMEIEGGAKLKGAVIDSFGDHRIAMAFAIAGLHAEGTTTINDTDCISTSYPGFERELQRFLTAEKDNVAPIPVVSRMPRGMGIETLSNEDIAD